MIKSNKVISVLLAMTIVLGMVTPVYAADETFNLKNAELEKVSDDADIIEDVKEETNKSEEENNNVNKNNTEDIISEKTDEEAEKDPGVEDNTILKDGKYSIGAKYLKTGTQIGDEKPSAAANYFEKNSDLLVGGGKYTLILYTKGNSMAMMSNISVKVDKKDVKLDVNKSNGTITFEIQKLSSDIQMACGITIPGMNVMNVDFNVVLDKDNIVNKETNEKVEVSQELKNNTKYTINNKVRVDSNGQTSELAKYIDDSCIIEVDSNGNIYLTLNFKMSGLMNGRTITLNDNSNVTTYAVVNSGDTNGIRFKISSLTDKIHISNQYGSSVNDGLTLTLVQESLKENGTYSENDSSNGNTSGSENGKNNNEDTVTPPPTNVPSTNIPSGNIAATEQNNKLTYKVKNQILTDSQIGYQAARGAVNETSVYEVENGKKYITLGFGQTDILNNIRISNKGKEVPYTIVREDKANHTVNIKFEIPTISTEFTITANVNALGRDISFGIKFLESTLELISTEESENISNGIQNKPSGIISGLSSTAGSLNDSKGDIEATEEAVENLADIAKEYFKKYTINNEVVSDSAIGRTMARKYLSETSIIEEIDGQFYAIITFSSASAMGNFRIEVNGETVSHTVALKDMGNDLISLRFPISSVNDTIRVYIYINPVKMNINFGIKFLEDTMVLIEEGTVGEEGENESSSLAYTLTNLNRSSQGNNKSEVSTIKFAAYTAVMVIVLNKVIAALAALFKRFKSKCKPL